jgi:hypothetical protein
MRRLSRRSMLASLGAAVGLAGCSADSNESPDSGTATATPTATSTPTVTATPTATATPTPTRSFDGPLGFESMLRTLPAHPESADPSAVWARYVDVGRVMDDVEDDTIAGRLRDGWLSAGPPTSTESDAFELLYLQPGALSNVTLGHGAFDTDAAVATMVDDGWTRRPDAATAGFRVLAQGGYTAAVAAPFWFVTSAADPPLVTSLAARVGTDPFAAALDPVDREAMARASEEDGEYRVLERSTAGDGYAAGIALNFGSYRAPVGVVHYAAGRGSAWQRVERRFPSVPGELRAEDFSDGLE